jgi:hypothetical protein
MVTARHDTKIECFLFKNCMLQRVLLDLVTSFRSSPVDYSGRAVFLPPGRRDKLVVFFGAILTLAMLFCAMRISRILRIDGAKRQSMTSVGEVTAEEGTDKLFFPAKLD